MCERSQPTGEIRSVSTEANLRDVPTVYRAQYWSPLKGEPLSLIFVSTIALLVPEHKERMVPDNFKRIQPKTSPGPYYIILVIFNLMYTACVHGAWA